MDVSKDWSKLYRYGYIAAILIALLLIGEVFVYALIPDRSNPVEVFALFHESPISGLLLFDLLGMISYLLFIPFILSLFLILKHSNRALMLVATVLFFIGIAVFFANNTGFSVLSLSRLYEVAETEEAKAMLLASCQTMMTLFDVNAFMISYVMVSIAWVMSAVVMLKSKVFNRTTAWLGIIAGASGVLAEIIENTLKQFVGVAICFYFLAIVFLIGWVVLTGKRLYQISINLEKDD